MCAFLKEKDSKHNFVLDLTGQRLVNRIKDVICNKNETIIIILVFISLLIQFKISVNSRNQQLNQGFREDMENHMIVYSIENSLYRKSQTHSSHTLKSLR